MTESITINIWEQVWHTNIKLTIETSKLNLVLDYFYEIQKVYKLIYNLYTLIFQ